MRQWKRLPPRPVTRFISGNPMAGSVYDPFQQSALTLGQEGRTLVSGQQPTQSPRPSAQAINSAPRIVNSGSLLTGDNATVPLAYGRVSIEGRVIAQATYGGALYIAVGWCLGEIYAFESVWINDELPPAGVEVRHYRGTTTQGVDPWLAAAIPGYADTCVVTDRGELIGLAYSVFKVTTSAISGVPYLKAIILSKLITDPNAASNSDPFFDLNAVDVDFQAGGTDQSGNAHTITLQGGATIDSGGLQLSGGGGDYATIADHASLEVGSSQFTLEIPATSDTIAAGTATLIAHTNSAATRSLQVDRDTDDLLLYLSSDGTTWDIANGVNVGTITTAKFWLDLERVGNEFVAYLNGAETARIASSAAIFDSGCAWYLGSYNGGALWEGAVHAFRLLVGNIRYGAEHEATTSPFADSETYGAQTVYSTNPALMWADMASSNLYGLGATTDGVAYAADYCLDILDASCGTDVQRCETGIVLPANREVEYWLDLLSMYANCIWYPWGSDLRIQPDERVTALAPCGRDILLQGDFDASSEWTQGTGWAIGSGVAAVDGTQAGDSLLSQTLVTESLVEYAVSITITAISAGSIRVEFDGAEVIAAQTAAGTYAALVYPTGTSADLDIIADLDAVATISVASVKRSYYLETKWLPGSLAPSGPSERGTPTSVKANYTIPASDTPNWGTASTVKTSPYAEDGTLPFIQTTLDLPGVFTAGEANNKTVQRVQRMHNRFNAPFTTKYHGLRYRKGDAIQLVSGYRGIDDPVWCESVEMIEPGIFRVSGSKYSNLHFPDYCDLEFPPCSLWGVATTEDTLSLIWESAVGNYPSTVATMISYGGLMACKNDLIFQNEVTNATYTNCDLLVSDDFGDNWTGVSAYFDSLWDSYYSADYTTNIYPNTGHVSFRFIGDRLYTNLYYDVTRSGTILSTLDGVTWRHEHTMWSNSTYASDPNTMHRYVNEYSIYVGETAYGGEFLISGRFNSSSFCYQEGSGFTALGVSLSWENPGQFVVATDTSGPMGISMAGSQIHQLTDGWTYMADGSSSVWCDDKSGTAFVDYVAFGVDWGFGYGGTFRASEAGGIYKNSYLTATGTRRHGWATDKTSLLVPKGSNEAEGHADMGVYCLMSGSSYSEVDYSDLVVKETGDYDLYALRLLYVAEAEKWILIYAFESSSGGADPTHFYIRASSYYDPEKFGAAVKVNVPSGWYIKTAQETHGAMEVGYSVTQSSWLFSTFVYDGASTYKQILGTISDPFICIMP